MTTSTLREDVLERRARVAALTRAGRTAREIAAVEGVTIRTVTRIRARAGESARGLLKPLTEDELRTARELLEDGCSYAEAARTVGRSPRSISYHFPGFGWPKGEGPRFAQQVRWAEERAARNGVLL
ncbi:helix-turn-helix domain-containing protein [Mycobacterium yunnanensis]|uniref:Helix-turn-helix domain-containing protein n=1 Tax=Mycobacterium yunnanensis TaxID=368477 RepID=A0A9X2Z7G4_9MYCO|nr:helix-turn-helix domain-containing protein [Mycobacterium yunnanensis]MCV7424383.1 helix-turn-helix domain-containing protein [Mycobacterium yunnanensis]